MRKILGSVALACFLTAVVGCQSKSADETQPRTRSIDQSDNLQPAKAATMQTGNRRALVIGNSNYKLQPLRNPTNDADVMKATLEDLDFEVTVVKDLDLAQMDSSLREFKRSLGRGDMAVVYFSGHGCQVNKENFLIPLRAEIEEEYEIATKCLPLARVLGALQDSGSNLNVVILDCCRNNPFGRSWSRGATSTFAALRDVPKGTVVAYATAGGKTAADGAGENSPYTAALVSALHNREQDLEIVDAFRTTGEIVGSSTGQRPHLYFDTSMGRYYLWRKSATPSSQSLAAQPEQPSENVTGDRDPKSAAMDPPSQEVASEPAVLLEPFQYPNIKSVNEVIEQWNEEQHLYVKGDLGIGAAQFEALEQWLDDNAPHWTIVLMQNAEGEFYNDFRGMDAVEYALGEGLARRTNFGELRDSRTSETDGAVFVLFSDDRKFSYYGSVAQDVRNLGESHWVGELDRPAFHAMRDGERVLDAVKDAILNVNSRLTKKIEAERKHDTDAPKAGQQLLAAIVAHGGKTWFFKLSGSADAVAPLANTFETFVQSLKFGEDPPVAWDVPEGWTQEPGFGMRFATLKTPGGLDLTVIAIGGDAGGLLPNINRWRNPMGLGPVSDAELPSISKTVEVGGKTVTVLNFGAGPGVAVTGSGSGGSVPAGSASVGSDLSQEDKTPEPDYSDEEIVAEFGVSRELEELGTDWTEILLPIIREAFGTLNVPKYPENLSFAETVDLQRGGAMYGYECAKCHGSAGDGNGPDAGDMRPRPRDFRMGIAKFTSLPFGVPPSKNDLRETVRIGVPGTEMPAFSHLTPSSRAAVAEYVRWVMLRGVVLRRLISASEEYSLASDRVRLKANLRQELLDLSEDLRQLWEASDDPSKVIQPLPRVSFTAESIERGRRLFQESSCYTCHETNLRGQAEKWTPEFVAAKEAAPSGSGINYDAWGDPAPTYDLTAGKFHGGNGPDDLYRRIHSGIGGTPHPALGQMFSSDPNQIWDLVNFFYDSAGMTPGTDLPRCRDYARFNDLAIQKQIRFAEELIQADKYSQAKEILMKLADKGLTGFANPLGIACFCTNEFALAEEFLTKAVKNTDYEELTPRGYELLTKNDFSQLVADWKQELALREQEAAADDLPRVLLKTTAGDITVELFENEAPETVGNFVSLVEKGFYDGLTFHRVLSGFMAQGGCPNGNGSGGPGYRIYCEFTNDNHRKHFAGSLSMAKETARHTGGSQFFINFVPTPHLNGRHTVFGRVVDGMDVLTKITRINPEVETTQGSPTVITKATVLRKRDHEYRPNKVN